MVFCSVDKTPPKLARLRKRLQKVETLPAADQRAVLKLIDALHTARQRERPARSTRTARLAHRENKQPGTRAGL